MEVAYTVSLTVRSPYIVHCFSDGVKPGPKASDAEITHACATHGVGYSAKQHVHASGATSWQWPITDG